MSAKNVLFSNMSGIQSSHPAFGRSRISRSDARSMFIHSLHPPSGSADHKIYNPPQNECHHPEFLHPLPSPPTMSRTRLRSLATQLPRLDFNVHALTKFTHFQKLPTELRRMVWAFIAMNERRDIRLYRHRNIGLLRGQRPDRVPSILHANSEARQVGLRDYKPLYLMNFGLSAHKKNRRYIYFNPKTDLLLSLCNISGIMDRFSPVQEIGERCHYGIDYMGCCCSLETQFWRSLLSYNWSGIMSLTLVVGDYDSRWRAPTLTRALFKEALDEAMMKRLRCSFIHILMNNIRAGVMHVPVDFNVEWRVTEEMDWRPFTSNFQRYYHFDKNLCMGWVGS